MIDMKDYEDSAAATALYRECLAQNISFLLEPYATHWKGQFVTFLDAHDSYRILPDLTVTTEKQNITEWIERVRYFTAKVLPALFREHYDTPGLAAYGSMQIIGRFVAREFRLQKSSNKHVCGREEQKVNEGATGRETNWKGTTTVKHDCRNTPTATVKHPFVASEEPINPIHMGTSTVSKKDWVIDADPRWVRAVPHDQSPRQKHEQEQPPQPISTTLEEYYYVHQRVTSADPIPSEIAYPDVGNIDSDWVTSFQD